MNESTTHFIGGSLFGILATVGFIHIPTGQFFEYYNIGMGAASLTIFIFIFYDSYKTSQKNIKENQDSINIPNYRYKETTNWKLVLKDLQVIQVILFVLSSWLGVLLLLIAFMVDYLENKAGNIKKKIFSQKT